MEKVFKVAQHFAEPVSGSLYSHLLVSQDGEAFEILRGRVGNPPLNPGDAVSIPLLLVMSGNEDRSLTPDFDSLGVSYAARRCVPNIYKTVVEVWGDDVAGKHLTPPVAPRLVKVPHSPFTPDDFVDAQRWPAEQKSLVANLLIRFIQSGFVRERFFDPLHQALCNCFGFGRADIESFWTNFLATAEAQCEFIRIIASHVPAGNPEYGLVDVEQQVRAWVVQSGVIARVIAAKQTAADRRERQELHRLLAKYGLPRNFKLPGQP